MRTARGRPRRAPTVRRRHGRPAELRGLRVARIVRLGRRRAARQVVNRDGFAAGRRDLPCTPPRRSSAPLGRVRLDARRRRRRAAARREARAASPCACARRCLRAVARGPGRRRAGGHRPVLDRGRRRTESIAVERRRVASRCTSNRPAGALDDALGRRQGRPHDAAAELAATRSATSSRAARPRHVDRPPLAPGDIAVDHRGHRLDDAAGGNAIGRIDPAPHRDGTGDGIRIYPLNACGVHECAVPFPADPRDVVPSREPLQMDVAPTARAGPRCGSPRSRRTRSACCTSRPTARPLDRADMSCGCGAPAGIALDAAGDVWFTEGSTNRIGRLTPGITNPSAPPASGCATTRSRAASRRSSRSSAASPVVTSLPH